MSETCQKLAFTHPIVVLKSGLKNNWMKKLDLVNRPLDENNKIKSNEWKLVSYSNKSRSNYADLRMFKYMLQSRESSWGFP